jgi:hypothetical protein
MEDLWIKVPVRYCRRAKALGRQYTRRLLPDFLTPFARMRLDNVIDAGREKADGSTVEKCCRIIGCIDLRTARVHLKRLEEAAKIVALTLAENQAASIHLHQSDYSLSPLTTLGRLEKLLDRQMEGQLRGGNGKSRSPSLRSLLQAELWKKKRKSLTSYVSRPPPES